SRGKSSVERERTAVAHADPPSTRTKPSIPRITPRMLPLAPCRVGAGPLNRAAHSIKRWRRPWPPTDNGSLRTAPPLPAVFRRAYGLRPTAGLGAGATSVPPSAAVLSPALACPEWTCTLLPMPLRILVLQQGQLGDPHCEPVFNHLKLAPRQQLAIHPQRYVI